MSSGFLLAASALFAVALRAMRARDDVAAVLWFLMAVVAIRGCLALARVGVR